MERYPDIRECDGVYPPREDSYLLYDSIEVKGRERFLEIGTGTGLISIGAALHGAEVYATDIDEKALKCAKKNAETNGVEVELIRADMLRGIKGGFDIVAFNPPYLPDSGKDYDLKQALESGKDGTEHILTYLNGIERVLKEGGKAYFVASSHTGRIASISRNVRKIAEKSLFFEKLYVLMFSHKKDL